MNKKGQLLERPFIFIFIAVVSAFIFIFGFYLIKNLIKANNCAQLGLAVSDLNKAVERYYNFDTGSSTEISLKLPSKISNVCFINSREDLDRADIDKIDKNLYDIFQNLHYNVIFLPLNYCTKSFFKLDKVVFNKNPLCVLNNGNIKLNLENKGTYVEIRT